MKITTKCLGVFFIATGLISCGSLLEKADEASDLSDTAVATAAVAKELNGTWLSECVVDEADESFQIKVKFTASTILSTSTEYANETCDSDVDMTQIYSYTFTADAEGDSEDVDGATNLVFTPVTATIEVNNSGILSDYNDEERCDKSDWEAGEVVNVLEKTCKGDDNSAKEYDLYKLSSDGKTLELGDLTKDDSKDGSSADKRPTVVGGTYFTFTKQ